MVSPTDVHAARELSELFDEMYVPMVGLAFRLVGNTAEAEEVVQDVFVELHLAWHRILNPGGWLRVAVVNGSRRRAKRRNKGKDLERAATVRPPITDRHYLLDVIERLPERHRTAVVLAYYADFTIAEIAQALDCRPGTAKSLVHRGIKRMEKELRDE